LCRAPTSTRPANSESGAGVFSQREGDLNKVFNGADERFEIPDAVIYGG
jgi:hypothetical protein